MQNDYLLFDVCFDVVVNAKFEEEEFDLNYFEIIFEKWTVAFEFEIFEMEIHKTGARHFI